MSANPGWVTVGRICSRDLAALVAAHRGNDLPGATEGLIIADGGGSNGSRPRLGKTPLQQLANETRLRIAVCHLPPGTSKWNKIEHRLFAYSTQNGRARPLISHEVIVELIGNTATQTGLRIQAELDTHHYATGPSAIGCKADGPLQGAP